MNENEYINHMRGLLGTLTSYGTHKIGLIESYAYILLEDIEAAEFADKALKQECVTNAKILASESQKHLELIKKILNEWQEISDVYRNNSD